MTEGNREVATLGGGCFWCTEAVFDRLKGVISVESGYAGGRDPNPTYDDVCSGQTGHAEVVQVTFDPAQISYADILRVFFGTHDPTTLNRQGADKGTQYRSVIFYHSEEQRRVAEDVMRDLGDQEVFESPIVTELSPAPTFYMAESYHQEFFARNPGQGYCQVVVAPKVAKFRKEFAGLFRD
ncbi:peptide-methionine (S)-S-oxide reductase MsrA [Longimicrobium terrae]|uniref:Peptide methionine sulfoxide reductase MsrA n=1 Tax=Longimicrobium terrae TaxID=1639882 RepID=A0A841H3V4_9BACT|nr:peptide-methionine (S)-S-oxide reductase MsrA [Longimicrobium terrae]MBB4638346.1 peptide-methionine (S)-S-oxide reductase [Longimicrobium terrae]MBB6072586.1 peptide-methionine (S)-S-oxide reductase [Longimicrobium terrae]NNC28635.1 peptide-methionine (S)-S-oxide reductase MsrA [Longimicrobium terrae]